MPEPIPRTAPLSFGSRILQRVVSVEPHEISALFWSFAYFFSLLCGYYILRPLRDEMGIAGGVENLQWVFTGTFITTLAAVPFFGYVSARLPRQRLLPLVYYFFIANILIFYLLFNTAVGQAYVARAFFVWTSVFNLFVVSVFWSFMADLFTNVQARRLFGFIAAGGSAGAVTGPSFTALLATRVGPVNLLLISALLLALAVVCIHRLSAWSDQHRTRGKGIEIRSASREPLGGSPLAGIRLVFGSPYLLGICAFIWLYTSLSTFLYFTQAQIVAQAFDDPGARTTLFAGIDLAVNTLTITTQVLVTNRLMKWLGLPRTLALVPLLMIVGFIALGVAPVLPVLIAFQIVRRAGNYAVARPAREVLFTVVAREAKYKAKNFIDTVVYRGGDALSGWVFVGLNQLGLGLSAIALVAVPIAALWFVTGLVLGRKQERLRQEVESQR